MNVPREEHFVGEVAQKAIVEWQEKILITRDERDEETWELPGGRLNADETPVAGLIRELQEELGVACTVVAPVYVGRQFHDRDQRNMLVVVYRVVLVDPTASFVFDPREVAEHAWVDAANWKSYRLYPEYHQALKRYFADAD